MTTALAQTEAQITCSLYRARPHAYACFPYLGKELAVRCCTCSRTWLFDSARCILLISHGLALGSCWNKSCVTDTTKLVAERNNKQQ
eukprot:78950-Heterocapsa_arctica.AAC.1